jgi:hypothetical protein
MFVIRREQDRLAPLAPFVRHLVRSEPDGSFWTPGLMLMLADIGEAAEAATLLADLRRGGFELPPDAMWGTVMALLAEAAATLNDRASARLLLERLATQSGTALVTGHGIVSFGSADRYLGMLALVLGDPELAARLRAVVGRVAQQHGYARLARLVEAASVPD